MPDSEANSTATASPRSLTSASWRRLRADRMPWPRSGGSTGTLPTRTRPADRGHRAKPPHLEAERARPADNRAAVERGQGPAELETGQEVGVGALGHRRAMGRVLVHGEKGSELVFGDQADRVGVHVRLPTKRTRTRPLLIARDCILVKPHESP